MTSQIYLQALWNLESNNLFEDLDKFIDEWGEKLKKCKCKYPECNHYQKEKWDRFGKKMKKLFNQSLIMSKYSFISVLKQSD